MSYQQAMYDREHPRYSEPTEYITMEVDGLIVALRFKNAVKIEYGLDSSMILQSRPMTLPISKLANISMVWSYSLVLMGKGMVTSPYSGYLALLSVALISIAFFLSVDFFHPCSQALLITGPTEKAMSGVWTAFTAGEPATDRLGCGFRMVCGCMRFEKKMAVHWYHLQWS